MATAQGTATKEETERRSDNEARKSRRRITEERSTNAACATEKRIEDANPIAEEITFRNQQELHGGEQTAQEKKSRPKTPKQATMQTKDTRKQKGGAGNNPPQWIMQKYKNLTTTQQSCT